MHISFHTFQLHDLLNPYQKSNFIIFIMNHFNNQQEAPVSYPAQVQAPYVSAPPPLGYPSKDEPATVGYPQQRVSEETTSKGDGFWKGCCAALCCCWILDCCF